MRQATGGLPPTFWYLWWGNLANRSGAFVAIVLTFYLQNERGFDAGTVGFIVGMIGAGGAIGALLGGQLADRHGRRSCLLLSHTLTAALLVLLSLGRDFWMLALTALLLGTSQSMARPAFGAMMVDIVPAADRVRAFSLNFWANNLAFTIAALLGGFLAEQNYTAVFLVNAAATLAMAAVVFVKAPESRPEPTGGTARATQQTPLRDPHFMAFCGLIFAGTVIFLQYLSTLPLDMNAQGMSAQVYGIVMSVNALMIVVGQIFVADLVKGRDRIRTLAFTYVVVGTGFGLTVFAEHAWVYALTVAVWTCGEMLQSPGLAATLADLSPQAARARYQSFFSLAIAAAGFVAPTLGGQVFERWGSTSLWIGCFVLGLATAAFTLAMGPAWNRRIAALKERERPVESTAGSGSSS